MMKNGLRHAGACALAASLAAAASADEFTFADVPDWTQVTRSTPLVLSDSAGTDLTATLMPINDGGVFWKTPPNSAFPAGSAGALQEDSLLAGGVEILFNQTVFCVPGMEIGPPIVPQSAMCDWETRLGDVVVASGTAEYSVDPDSGAAHISLVLPEGEIDRITLRTYVPVEDGDDIPWPMMLGDFFAVAVDDECIADADGSGSVDSGDFFTFIADFLGGASGADIDGSGSVDSGDFFTFIGAFLAGC